MRLKKDVKESWLMFYKLIDTHCHLDMEEFDEDRKDVIERSKTNGVESIIIPSTVEENYDKELALCEKYNGFLYYLVGIHPHDAKTCTSKTYDVAFKHLSNSYCLGIGEIGLDYFYEHTQRAIQKDVFSNSNSGYNSKNGYMVFIISAF